MFRMVRVTSVLRHSALPEFTLARETRFLLVALSSNIILYVQR